LGLGINQHLHAGVDERLAGGSGDACHYEMPEERNPQQRALVIGYQRLADRVGEGGRALKLGDMARIALNEMHDQDAQRSAGCASLAGAGRRAIIGDGDACQLLPGRTVAHQRWSNKVYQRDER
jgi:hypothetical protein